MELKVAHKPLSVVHYSDSYIEGPHLSKVTINRLVKVTYLCCSEVAEPFDHC